MGVGKSLQLTYAEFQDTQEDPSQKKLEEDFFDKVAAPEPRDPTIGIIQMQGHWIFHISLFIVMF